MGDLYISKIIPVPMEQKTLDNGSKCGLNWTLIGRYIFEGTPDGNAPIVILTWVFDLKDVKKEGFYGVTGRLCPSVNNGNIWTTLPIDINLTKHVQEVRAHMVICPNSDVLDMKFDLIINKYRAEQQEVQLFDPIFESSEHSDAVLLVDGRRLHVNKSFLSIHSEYFRSLFSANYAENNMKEIPIGEVTYEDFGTLLRVVYPRPIFPTDNTVQKILELADRFLMPGVIDHAEQHLVTSSLLENDRCLFLADKYRLPKLLARCMSRIRCSHDLNAIKCSTDYLHYSDETKAKILDRIINNVGWNPFRRECTTHRHSRMLYDDPHYSIQEDHVARRSFRHGVKPY